MVRIDSEFLKAFESYLNVKDLDSKTKEKYLFFFHKMANLYPNLNQKNVDTFLIHNQHAPARAMIRNLISSVKRWDFPEEIKKEFSMIDIPNKSTKQGKKQPKFIRKSDVDLLDRSIESGNHIKDERIRLMILMQFYGGLRINELINFTFNDLMLQDDKKENAFQVIKVRSESAKFGKEGKTYIPTHVWKRIFQWTKANITSLYSDKPFDKDKPLWDIKATRYKKLLGDWTLKVLGEPYNSHSLRHGRGYNLIAEEKRPIEIVQKYLRHADIKSTQIYAHIGDSEVKEALEENKTKESANPEQPAPQSNSE